MLSVESPEIRGIATTTSGRRADAGTVRLGQRDIGGLDKPPGCILHLVGSMRAVVLLFVVVEMVAVGSDIPG
jgi:hypothetical protein